ncbi:hypothetical protein BJ508DRAFT_302213 [Ascobolus immersus RN42]|uniref:Uncharacterized protein n=1 Tax=Ascobolus immersus RN42 TaxID=1160509 RepID=A0A3N4IJJ8_ASCIM|nr:hypothetical protein BJ508DRAFT_302213 [Ascobolus immersus RN42]
MVDLRTTIPYHQIPRNPMMGNGPPTKVVSLQQQQHLAQQHMRRRTSSSNVFPQNMYSPRRASSTTSSVSTSSNPSTSNQNTYVAQLRRQKATVWCSQSQAEDPRLVAAQKAEKVRAAMEITGASASTSSLFGGNGNGHEKIHSKHRSHKNKDSGAYAQPSLLIAAGLPARLSASEVEGDGSDEDEGLHHHPSRSSLARSHGSKGSHGSTASSRRATGISHQNAPSPPRQHTASSSGSGRQMMTPTVAIHPAPDHTAGYPQNPYQNQYQQQPQYQQQQQYQQSQYQQQPQYQSRFAGPPMFLDENRLVETPESSGPPTATLAPHRNDGSGYFSGSSGDNSSNGTPASNMDLKRAGSVDERNVRTLTMSGVRLFVANPD